MSARLIIAGGRDFEDQSKLHVVLLGIVEMYGRSDNGFHAIATGECPTGADFLGRDWIRIYDYDYEPFPADWNKHGRAAGPIRNREMAEWAGRGFFGVLVAFWDGNSRGTKSMIDEAMKAGLDVHVFRYVA